MRGGRSRNWVPWWVAPWMGLALLAGACTGGADPDAMAAPAAAPATSPAPPVTTPAPPPRPLVGAFYHLWNPENLDQGYLRGRLQPPQTSMATDAARGVAGVEEDIAAAAAHGIDFFAMDWWPGQPDLNRRIDERFLAAGNAGDLRFCIFYETQALERDLDHGVTRLDAGARRRLVEDLAAIGERYFRRPGYLRIDGRPVVILYLTRGLTGEVPAAIGEVRERLAAQGEDVLLVADELFWRVAPVRGRDVRLTEEPQAERALLFDGLTSYNLFDSDNPGQAGYGAASTFLADVQGLYRRWGEALGGRVPIVPSVIPGYNDLGLPSRAGHPVIPRQWEPGAPEASFFARLLDDTALPAVDPRLPMILVTSWNEWNEDTAIEPIQEAPPTTLDDSPSGREVTGGHAYTGYGSAYLEVLRQRFEP